MNKQLVLSAFLAVGLSAGLSAQNHSNQTLFDKTARAIKGAWHGIVPAWVAPVSVVGICSGAMCAYSYVQREKHALLSWNTFLTKEEILCVLGATLLVGAVSTLVQYKLSFNTPQGIINRANKLITKMVDKKLISRVIKGDSDAAHALSDQFILTNKYPLVVAVLQLENALQEIIILENKCHLALQYTNPCHENVRAQLSKCIKGLIKFRNVINNNLHYIKNDNWKMYHAQLQLMQTDKSVEAQQVAAQSQKSATRLAWLYAGGKLVGSLIKAPFTLLKYAARSSSLF